MPEGQCNVGRWVLYACLFAVSAVAMLFVSGIILFVVSWRFWLVPRGLIPGIFLLCTALLSGLLLVARRQRRRWLTALSLGGAFTAVLMLALALLHALRTEGPRPPKPLLSPSGKYVLTRHIEPAPSVRARDLWRRCLPFWFVTISEPSGRILYRDPQPICRLGPRIRILWDVEDRAWFSDSESHIVSFYKCVDGTWERHEWAYDKRGEIMKDIEHGSLYLDHAAEALKAWPLTWELSSLDRGFGPSGQITVSLRNTKTGTVMSLKVGEAKESITLVDADPRKEEVIVQFEGELYLLRKQTSP